MFYTKPLDVFPVFAHFFLGKGVGRDNWMALIMKEL